MLNTIAAISTPAGQGGIAVIRISGKDAYKIADKVFLPINKEKDLKKAKGYTALFGSFVAQNKKIDEGIALCFKAPHSYTGEEVVELSCHGGEVVSEEVLKACFAAGAYPAEAGEFTRRALENGKMSLTQAESLMDLISASSKQAAALAQASLSGRLAIKIEEIKQKLIMLAGHLAAFTDFPEEDVEDLSGGTFLGTVIHSKNALKNMLEGYEAGMKIRRGVSAVIVGSPNVGKSSLFNLLSGFQRAIVTPIAGTTRDVVREEIYIGGILLLVSDTAGLHETKDIVEVEGIRRSYEALAGAAFIMAVFDGTKPITDEDILLAKQCEDRPALALVNKSDLGMNLDVENLKPYFEKVLVVSAKSEESLGNIETAVKEILKVSNMDENTAILANQRQFNATKKAFDALEEAEKALALGVTYDAVGVCLDEALLALAALTGENISETVINDVFARFCVGK